MTMPPSAPIPLSFLIPLFLIVVGLAAYLWAVLKVEHRWSSWRILSFASGCALLLIAVSPPLAQFAHHDLRGHVLQHLLIGMFAPLALVLAAPFSLALRALPARVARSMVATLHRWPLSIVRSPVLALLLNIGGMYLLYVTPLYALTLHHASLHHLMNLHFLAAGYLFAWAIAGPDPAPARPGLRVRMVVLIIAIAAHANLSKLMYAYLWPRGTAQDPEQIRAAAQLMYYGGDLAELLLIIALFATWYHHGPSLHAKARAMAGQ